MSLSRRIVPCLVLAISLALMTSASCGGGTSRASRGAVIALEVDALDGGVVDLARYRGRVVVLHLFATWSLGASSDVIELSGAHDRHGERVTIIGVALDPDGYRLVEPWRRANQIPYLVTLGSPDLVNGKSALGPITQVPATIVLDRDGTVAARIDGPLRPGQLDSVLAERGVTRADPGDPG